jgi:FAD-linked oxidoreductase
MASITSPPLVKKKNIKNWALNLIFHAQQILYPKTEDEIISLMKEIPKNATIRPVGSLYSYTPLINTDDILISLDKYTGIESIDRDKLEVVIRAGTQLAHIERLLEKENLSLYNIGDINKQTIAGLISTASHGTGIKLGIASTQITKIRLVTASGEVIDCSKQQHPEIFKAAQVSLGVLGIITKITLQVLPFYWVEQKRASCSFDKAIENLKSTVSKNRNYEFFWFPYTNFVLEKYTNIIKKPEKKTNKLSRWFNDYILENLAIWSICRVSRFMPNLYKKAANRLFKILSSNATHKLKSSECYATTRLVKHYEVEYALPAQHAEEALIKTKNLLDNFDAHISFPIEVRFVAKDDIYLSPCYGVDTVWIAIHAYIKDEYENFFKAAEQIYLQYNGRPHWGKMHYQEKDSLKKMYPEWEKFVAIRRSLDPQNRFLNQYLAKFFE